MKAEAQDGVLARILAATAADLAGRAHERPEWERRAARAPAPPSFERALATGPVAVIAEVKRRSPSAGAIRAAADAVVLARGYAEAGAAAISVLTEQAHFGGSLEDLSRVAREVGLPVLRKDFVVDPLQIYEARAAGAAAVLLIVRVLAEPRLAELSALARELGLATLVEVHDAWELERAAEVRPTAIGVNARDLETLALDPSLAPALLPRVPPGAIAVAESGLKHRADVERVAACGADAVLVGTAVAGAGDPGAAVGALIGVPRPGRAAA